ncbi:alpha/beta hydrolase [Schlegelella sp. ID0723]|uniref:Alpha/beta hydrolase n=1 Tax=Piscinibacter koreensis TaxID=2742824 RepID=A0A7Y6NRD1_9BURK|nr:alpha/beta hydrolase [Schlegelella koreensis]
MDVVANGVRFHALAAGPDDGPLVLLLHGFPESAYGWRHQIGPLAAAGLRVVAPDQRGYAGSSKPRGRRAYRLDTLAADVVAIARAVGRERFAVVGHDWGGIVAWHLASHAPQHVERVAVINAPHLDTSRRHLLRHPSQWLRSAYVAAFQLPWLPERALTADAGRRLAQVLRRTSRPGTFDDAALAVHRGEWLEPGAMTAMLNWYRALPRRRAVRPIDVPVRVIWVDRDHALDAAWARASAALCRDAELTYVEGATHWVHHEEAERVNAMLVEFLAAR